MADSVPVRPPARNPFGIGGREAAPAATGFGAYILAAQAQFYRALQGAVLALKESGAAAWSLIGLGFAYGVFHAAGPGHGKAVIAAYLLSNGRKVANGMALSLAAALVQAVAAIALVIAVAVVVRGTAATMGRVTNVIEVASFAAVAALGAALVWQKAGKLVRTATIARDPAATAPPDPSCCDHAGLLAPSASDARDSASSCFACEPCDEPPAAGWREMVGVVLAAGARPCAGAVIVLVFSLSQGLFAAGVAATVAMALGTAVTTGALAALAGLARSFAVRVADGRGGRGALAMAGVELLAAALVLVLGASLLGGLWTAAVAS